MFEAYKVGVTIALTNKVSQGLMLIGKDMAKVDAQALKLKSTLNEIKLLGIGGALLGGAGYAGLHALGKAIAPAKEYAHQLNIMNMAGMKQAEIAESIKLAWKTSRDIMTTTPTQNLAATLDLKNITGSLEHAQKLLPIVSKIQTVMAASAEGSISKNAGSIGFAMGKALDTIGAVNNAPEMEKQASMMSKVVTAFQNRVTPQMFQGVFQYARQGKFDMSDEFKYEILPSLMLESATGKGGGGGSKGVGPMIAAMYRVTNQGYINKKSLAEWQKLGYVDGKTALKTTTNGTTVGAMKDAPGAAANPFIWVNKLVEDIRKKYGANVSDQFIRQELNGLFRGNQLAASGAVEFFSKQQNFLRDQQIIRGAQGYQAAFDSAMKNDPETAEAMADAQWKTLKIATGNVLLPVVIPALLKFAQVLRNLGQWTQRHPVRFEWIIKVFAGISAAMLTAGTLMAVAGGFKALKLAFGLMSTPLGSLATIDLAGVATGLGAIAATILRIAGPIAAVAGAAYYAGDASQFMFHKGQDIGHWINRKMGWEPNGTSGSWTPPSSDNTTTVHTTVNLDGRQMASVVTKHQTNAASSPNASGSRFDGRMTPVYSGTTGSW